MDEERLIKEISVLKLEPGDILVLKVDAKLSVSQYEGIMKQMKELTAGRVPIAILDQGMGLDKLSIPKENIIDFIVEDLRKNGKLRRAIEANLPFHAHDPHGHF
jgi:hypothetical protein